MILSRAGNFMWIVLAASIPPLVISMLLLPWTSSQFASEASIAFDNMHTCLAHNLNEAFSVTFPVSKTNNAAMQDALLKQSTELNTSYRQSSFELRFGRVSCKWSSLHRFPLKGNSTWHSKNYQTFDWHS